MKIRSVTHKIAALATLCLMLSATNAQTYTLTDDDVIVESGTIISCSYDTTNTDIIIPEKLDNQLVEVIGKCVFIRKGLSSVILPKSIRRIEQSAFF